MSLHSSYFEPGVPTASAIATLQNALVELSRTVDEQGRRISQLRMEHDELRREYKQFVHNVRGQQ